MSAGPQRVLIKICGITCHKDAEWAVRCGADALGFNFWPRSPRFIRAEKAGEIGLKLQQYALKVGVFVDPTRDEVERAVRVAGLDVAQIHGAVPAGLTTRYWQALEATVEWRARASQSQAEALLIDTPAGALRGGTGQTFDWSLLEQVGKPLVLAGGLGPDNVADAIWRVRPWGLDACSRLEAQPGRKDPERVRAFIAAAREAEVL